MTAVRIRQPQTAIELQVADFARALAEYGGQCRSEVIASIEDEHEAVVRFTHKSQQRAEALVTAYFEALMGGTR